MFQGHIYGNMLHNTPEKWLRHVFYATLREDKYLILLLLRILGNVYNLYINVTYQNLDIQKANMR